MYHLNIQLTDNQKVFSIGDTITGTALVTVSNDLPLSSVSVWFHCRVGLKGFNVADMLHDMHNYVYYEKDGILDQECNINTTNDKAQVCMSLDEPSKSKSITIPFSFTIPKDKELSSTMINSEICVKYFISSYAQVSRRGDKKVTVLLK